MKITYTKNPLNTIIELDGHDIEILRLKIIIEQFEYAVSGAKYHLDGIYAEPSIDKALKEFSVYLSDELKVKRVQQLLNHYTEELLNSHGGDCTCFACSCSKCHAEGLLGIDTIGGGGLGKHEAHKILTAFNYKDGDVWKERSLDEALEILRAYDPKPTADLGSSDSFEAHIPRWKEETKAAQEWLLTYRNQHFPKETE